MLNGLMNIGNSALNASQAWISVTGNNLANADTEGYSRQYVDQKDAGGLTYRPGAQPLGVNAQQVLRFFDAFLERSYVRQNANSSRWDQQDTIMASVENLFNEANRTGINSAMNNFFNAWQDLTLRPDDTSVRQSLISFADNLNDMFKSTMNSLNDIKEEMNVSIQQGVDRVNDLAKSIADLNRQITATTVDGISNPNALLDKRDQLVREMSEYVDVETIDHGKGDFRVQLSTGQPLVDGVVTYELKFDGPKVENQLMPGSNFKGTVDFQGSDAFEYTVRVVDAGTTGTAGDPGDPGNPKIEILVNGKPLEDANGNKEFEVTYSDRTDKDGNPITDELLIKDLRISFTTIDNFNKGDQFNVVPKSGLYWIEPTKGAQNVTPQIGFDGAENQNRVHGGKLAAYFNVRDDNIGRYEDELDAVARALIWEVNRLHSQGAGLHKLTDVTGTGRVEKTDVALGKPQAQLANGDRLQPGSIQLHFYDSKISGANHMDSVTLDFDGGNFNPAKHSLDKVAEAINTGAANYYIEASIQDNRLIIQAKPGVEFALGFDSTGLMAALGINTFFTGNDASSIGVNSAVHMDTNLLAAGQVNGAGEINVGDNATATAIGKLATKNVRVSTMWKTVDNQSISQFYANLVSTVGADRRTTKTNTEYHGALANDLYERVSSVTGVNMDEEMANLIKFQHSYTAAAKLITTADQMLQTLLGLKQ